MISALWAAQGRDLLRLALAGQHDGTNAVLRLADGLDLHSDLGELFQSEADGQRLARGQSVPARASGISAAKYHFWPVMSLPTALPGTADACCAAARSSLGFICSTLSGREHALKAVRLLGKIAGALDRHGLGALLRLGGERGDLRLELGDAALHARGVVRRHAAAQHEWLQLGHHIVGLRQITAGRQCSQLAEGLFDGVVRLGRVLPCRARRPHSAAAKAVPAGP